jgi:FixJ family two-component response regulator
MSLIKAIKAGAKDFLDLSNLPTYFNKIDDIQETITKKIRNQDQSEEARTTQSKLLAA